MNDHTLSQEARRALLDHGPRALTALDHMIEAADPGLETCCEGCGLRRVDNFRNSVARNQLAAMRGKLANLITEAHNAAKENNE